MTKIPLSLKSVPQWINWQLIPQEKGPAKKMPMTHLGKPASSTDHQTWTTFDVVNASAGKFSGIGFVFCGEDPFCGIDLDGCRDPKSGQVAPWAKKIISVFDSYAEVSPSLTGVKIFIKGKLPMPTGRKVALSVDKVCDKEPAIEAYDHGRYFAVTGMKLAGVPDEPEVRQVHIEEFCKKYFTAEPIRDNAQQTRLSVIERARKYLDTIPGSVSGSGGHNQAFKTACILVLGFGLTKSESLILLSDWNRRCEPPWKERELQHKVDSADKQSGDRGYLRGKSDAEWKSTKLPEYKEPEAVDSGGPTITTLQDATESYLSKINGTPQEFYRIGLPDIDNALGGGLSPGEMVIIAARPGHGKTAFGMQFLDHTSRNQIPCGMISEEMSRMALAERAVLYGSDIPKDQWGMRTKELVGNMAEHFLHRAPCYIVEHCSTAARASDAIHQLASKRGVKVVAVDYAQLLSSPGKSRYEQITNTSITLARAAKETNVVLLVMCQLSRSIESRDKFMPHMDDLKDTGQLEQDADVIMFLVWPHRINPDNPEHNYQVWFGKNKMRGIAKPAIDCEFYPERQKIALAQFDYPTGTVYSGKFNKKKAKHYGEA